MADDLSPVPAPAAGPVEAQRNARYAYLVGRLRNRQMTMEEATELFGIMQGMVRQGEAARQALMRMPPIPSTPGVKERPPPPVSGAPTAASDDFFLLGILAMGAGAGLLAAMTKRMQDLSPPAAPPRRGRPDEGDSNQ
jgi:hypothetical protein